MQDFAPSLKGCNKRKLMCKVILYIYWKEKPLGLAILKEKKLKVRKIKNFSKNLITLIGLMLTIKTKWKTR